MLWSWLYDKIVILNKQIKFLIQKILKILLKNRFNFILHFFLWLFLIIIFFLFIFFLKKNLFEDVLYENRFYKNDIINKITLESSIKLEFEILDNDIDPIPYLSIFYNIFKDSLENIIKNFISDFTSLNYYFFKFYLNNTYSSSTNTIDARKVYKRLKMLFCVLLNLFFRR